MKKSEQPQDTGEQQSGLTTSRDLESTGTFASITKAVLNPYQDEPSHDSDSDSKKNEMEQALTEDIYSLMSVAPVGDIYVMGRLIPDTPSCILTCHSHLV